ncbi:MAG: AtpZ/AtpI family protein [Anaerolineae bacterium]
MSGSEGSEERKGLGWREGAIIAEGVAQIGCLTVVVILGALALGLWLDSHLGTRPWFTLGLVLGSIPVSLILSVYVALATARRTQPPPTKMPQEGSEEDKV